MSRSSELLKRARKSLSVVAGLAVAGVAVTLMVSGAKPASAIVNGQPVDASQYPFMAHIEIASTKPRGEPDRCSGALVAPEWVLTAAHCVESRPAKSRITVQVDTSNFKQSPGFTSRVSGYAIPPKYSSQPGILPDWDVALIRLTTPAPDSIPPVAIATQADFSALLNGEHVAVGYGQCVPDSFFGADENASLRMTKMGDRLQLVHGGLRFTVGPASSPSGVKGCPTSAPNAAPAPQGPAPRAAAAAAQPTPTPTPTPGQCQPPSPTTSGFPSPTTTAPPTTPQTPTPTPSGPPALPPHAVPLAPASTTSLGTPSVTATSAYPYHGDSGGPLLGRKCTGEWVELGDLSGHQSVGGAPEPNLFTYTNLSSPEISAWLSHVMSEASLTITTTLLPDGSLDTPYQATLKSQGGKAPLVWSFAAGRLPTGLAVAPDGAISGAPKASGLHTFLVRLVDAYGMTTDESLSIDVIK